MALRRKQDAKRKEIETVLESSQVLKADNDMTEDESGSKLASSDETGEVYDMAEDSQTVIPEALGAEKNPEADVDK